MRINQIQYLMTLLLALFTLTATIKSSSCQIHARTNHKHLTVTHTSNKRKIHHRHTIRQLSEKEKMKNNQRLIERDNELTNEDIRKSRAMEERAKRLKGK